MNYQKLKNKPFRRLLYCYFLFFFIFYLFRVGLENFTLFTGVALSAPGADVVVSGFPNFTLYLNHSYVSIYLYLFALLSDGTTSDGKIIGVKIEVIRLPKSAVLPSINPIQWHIEN